MYSQKSHCEHTVDAERSRKLHLHPEFWWISTKLPTMNLNTFQNMLLQRNIREAGLFDFDWWMEAISCLLSRHRDKILIFECLHVITRLGHRGLYTRTLDFFLDPQTNANNITVDTIWEHVCKQNGHTKNRKKKKKEKKIKVECFRREGLRKMWERKFISYQYFPLLYWCYAFVCGWRVFRACVTNTSSW